ncbi:MAG: GGDEF domain-containing protein [Sandarakinorhabdus sp.]|nr:GGDEF domain-containing protein [Sandarakinorhabdus sp.]
MLMIDADWFKAFNDSQRHAAGDTALRRIGAVLANRSPVGSAVVRLGGEEFAVLTRLPDSFAASLLAEDLRGAVAALAIPHPRAPASRLTVSIGVAVTQGDDSDVLMAAADTALYAAEIDGRNCVRAADPAAATATASASATGT